MHENKGKSAPNVTSPRQLLASIPGGGGGEGGWREEEEEKVKHSSARLCSVGALHMALAWKKKKPKNTKHWKSPRRRQM